MRKNKKEIIFLTVFIFSAILFLIIVIHVNLTYSGYKQNKIEERCLEICDEINDFKWDLLEYTINETYGFVDCVCIRKIRDSIGFTQGVGVFTEHLYFDLNTFEKITQEEISKD